MKNLIYIISGLSLLIFLSCQQQVAKKEGFEDPEFKLTADPNNGSIKLNQEGFKALVVADNLGTARHIAVRDNGDIYVKLAEGGVAALRDTTGNGKAEIIKFFDEPDSQANRETGIEIQDGYLYYASDTSVFRVKLGEDLVPSAEKEVIVAELPTQQSHAAKSLALDGKGNLYVNVGAPSNACQEEDRKKGSPAMDPCPILEWQGGIWRFSDSELNQEQKEDGYKYATGMRNMVAIDWDPVTDALYGVQHGRDDLHRLFPDLYTVEENAELPAEEFIKIDDGDNFGWPYCYYDHFKEQKVLNPEYGGDGEKVGRCEEMEDPIIAFPGHWGPNDLVFYTGDMFPEKYRNGAFVAFHGSWNRAPRPQQGYNVIFVPFENGEPTGEYEVFANQFAGSGEPFTSPSDAEFRPTGVAVGADGSLYISETETGRIWRVFYEPPKEA